jgi:co-chaperonin GroES (HSP10)
MPADDALTGPRFSIVLSPHPTPTQFKAVKPSGDRVLVKVDKEEGKTQGGVLLPTVAQNKPTAGAVVALGDVELVKVRPPAGHSPLLHALAARTPCGPRGPTAAAPAAPGRPARCACSCARPPPLPAAAARARPHPHTRAAQTTRNVQSGDRVVYSKYAGTELAISGDEHVLLKVRPRADGDGGPQHLRASASGRRLRPVTAAASDRQRQRKSCATLAAARRRTPEIFGWEPEPPVRCAPWLCPGGAFPALASPIPAPAPPPSRPQEDDVIGVLTSGDNIAKLKPLGDRVLIKVRRRAGPGPGPACLPAGELAGQPCT